MTAPTAGLQICPHWSQYIIRPYKDALVILFRCDAPRPDDEENGRGDLPRARECFIYPEQGQEGDLWKQMPLISWVVFHEGSWVHYFHSLPMPYPEVHLALGTNLIFSFESGTSSSTLDRNWEKASKKFHAILDKLEEAE